MATTVNVKVEGAAETVHALGQVKDGVANRVTGQAIRKVASRVNKLAKSRVKTRSGQTKRAIGVVMRRMKKGGTVLAVVGPRKGYRVAGPDGRPHDPVKTAHLVEGGRGEVKPNKKRILANKPGGVVYGRRARPVAAAPFMKPAADDAATAGKELMKKEIQEGLEREAAKYSKKGKNIYTTNIIK